MNYLGHIFAYIAKGYSNSTMICADLHLCPAYDAILFFFCMRFLPYLLAVVKLFKQSAQKAVQWQHLIHLEIERCVVECFLF